MGREEGPQVIRGTPYVADREDSKTPVSRFLSTWTKGGPKRSPIPMCQAGLMRMNEGFFFAYGSLEKFARDGKTSKRHMKDQITSGISRNLPERFSDKILSRSDCRSVEVHGRRVGPQGDENFP
jgi:hypothetical protein